MKNSFNRHSERLLINKAIRNLDPGLYSQLKSPAFNFSEDEIKTAILLKFGYSTEDIGVYTSLKESEISKVISSIFKKTGIKNINQINKCSVNNKKGGNPK